MHKAKHGAAVFIVMGLVVAATAARADKPTTLPFAEFWASGTSTKETCNTTQTCIAGSGSGRLKVSFAPPGPLVLLDTYNWTASLVVDSGNTTPNGFGGTCSAVGGSVAFTPPNAPTEILVLAVQGLDCQIGADASAREITASYLVDPAQSTGRFTQVTGAGSFNWASDASGSPTIVHFAGVGAKQFPTGPI
jgi:hypothetical protein